MGHISMATRDELVVALAGRYASSSRKHRGGEFVAVSGFHGKHAMWLLRVGRSGKGARRPAHRMYGEAGRVALIVIRGAADRGMAYRQPGGPDSHAERVTVVVAIAVPGITEDRR